MIEEKTVTILSLNHTAFFKRMEILQNFPTKVFDTFPNRDQVYEI